MSNSVSNTFIARRSSSNKGRRGKPTSPSSGNTDPLPWEDSGKENAIRFAEEGQPAALLSLTPDLVVAVCLHLPLPAICALSQAVSGSMGPG